MPTRNAMTLERLRKIPDVRELSCTAETRLESLLDAVTSGHQLACWKPDDIDSMTGTLVFDRLEIVNALLGMHVEPLPYRYFSVPPKVSRLME